MGRRSQRGLPIRRARPRPCHPWRTGVRQGRQISRAARVDPGKYRRLCLDIRSQHSDQPLWPAARRRLYHPGDLLRGEGDLYEHRADRCLSRRRPSGSHLRAGEAGRCRSARSRHRSRRDPAAQLHPARRLSLSDPGDAAIRLGRSRATLAKALEVSRWSSFPTRREEATRRG
jgi:hypothetical protein